MALNILTFKGVEGDERIHISRFNGSTWTRPQAIRGANSSAGPALAVFNGELHMTWKGAAGDQRIFHAIVEGTSIVGRPNHIPDAHSSTGPALAAFDGQLIVTWKGAAGDQRLFFSSFDGNTWTEPREIPNANSSADPALTRG